jgi:hypothetical protein
MMNATAVSKPTPVLDFRSVLKLDVDDTLDGYKLVMGGFVHIRLEEVEKAYLAADAAGLHPKTLVLFDYGSRHVGVVTGRNLSVTSNIGSPSRFPIEVHSSRGHFGYPAKDVAPISLPAHVIGLTKNAELLEGLITTMGVKVDNEGCTYATVFINGTEYSMRDVAVLELAPTLN